MQFIDLKTQYANIKTKVQNNINQVLEHGQFILGPEVKKLEVELANFAKVKYALAVGSGTAALQVALMALDVGLGDEVITSPFTFFASASTILLAGAKPVLVDVDLDTYNIDPNKIEEKITDKTKVIMPIDLYGQCANYASITEIAKKYDLKIIADAAQSFGARQDNINVGNFGDITCTSFYPAKPLGAYGEGGACFTNDYELALKMQKIHNHGQDGTYNHLCLGINARMDSLQAAVLLAKLSVYEAELSKRQIIAEKYNQLFRDIAITPFIKPNNYSSYAMYTLRVKHRDQLKKHLAEEGIPTAVHYPMPVHQQPAFKNLMNISENFPCSEILAKEVLSLPMHPYLTDEQIIFIADTVKNFEMRTTA